MSANNGEGKWSANKGQGKGRSANNGEGKRSANKRWENGGVRITEMERGRGVRIREK